MNSIFKVIWPLSIILLLALMVLRQGGVGYENPLSHHEIEGWLSISKR